MPVQTIISTQKIYRIVYIIFTQYKHLQEKIEEKKLINNEFQKKILFLTFACQILFLNSSIFLCIFNMFLVLHHFSKRKQGIDLRQQKIEFKILFSVKEAVSSLDPDD